MGKVESSTGSQASQVLNTLSTLSTKLQSTKTNYKAQIITTFLNVDSISL